MKKWLLFLLALLGFAAVFFFLREEHPVREEKNITAKTTAKNMDHVLAEDLSMTTEMFLSQLSMQLKQWAKTDLSDEKLKKEFIKQLSEHPHFASFAIVKQKKINSIPEGKITAKDLQKLKHETKNTKFSDPYQKENKYYLLIAEKMDDNTLVAGEVDLSFIRHFIKDIASVADANGNFFATGNDPHVHWKTADDVPKDLAKATVPKLGWQIVVHSKKEEKERPYHQGQAVIKLKDGHNYEQWFQKNTRHLELVKKHSPYFTVKAKNFTTEQLLAFLQKDPGIEFAEPNYRFSKQALPAMPNDEFYAPYQWNLTQIDIEKGWELTEGAKDVIIAIIDTGVDVKHQDLKEKTLAGYNVFDGSRDVTDTHGHGTHVAGIAAAVTNNIKGIAGIAKKNKILPIKVLNEKGEGTSFEVAEGIRYAVDNGASVINLSLGDYYDSRVLKEAVQYAYENDVVIVAASGNDNSGEPMYPAKYKQVLTVGAVNEERKRSFFSNYGNHLDVAAPGEHIPSTFPDDYYVIMSGTSMAAPHVAGLAALIRSVNPRLSNEEIYDIIRKTANDLGKKGRDPYYGYGEINIEKALKEALKYKK